MTYQFLQKTNWFLWYCTFSFLPACLIPSLPLSLSLFHMTPEGRYSSKVQLLATFSLSTLLEFQLPLWSEYTWITSISASLAPLLFHIPSALQSCSDLLHMFRVHLIVWPPNTSSHHSDGSPILPTPRSQISMPSLTLQDAFLTHIQSKTNRVS